jgi:hypothetical protein
MQTSSILKSKFMLNVTSELGTYCALNIVMCALYCCDVHVCGTACPELHCVIWIWLPSSWNTMMARDLNVLTPDSKSEYWDNVISSWNISHVCLTLLLLLLLLLRSTNFFSLTYIFSWSCFRYKITPLIVYFIKLKFSYMNMNGICLIKADHQAVESLTEECNPHLEM